MRYIDRLKQIARNASITRGHTLTKFERGEFYRENWHATCKVCDAYVSVKPKPAPNEIDISGEAVAVNCMPKSDAEYRTIVNNHGLPDPPKGNITDMRWQAGRNEWWAYVQNQGWYWLDDRIWKKAILGP